MLQNDIKKILAYSTCSQLGYMFFACGVSANQAALMHLGTHAFFKALLFLSAGSVIHVLSGEQNIKRMGGIWRKVPFTYTMMVIASVSLMGIFPFAGYFSKDLIFEALYTKDTAVAQYAFSLGIVTVFCTAFYSTRLLLYVFHGNGKNKVINSKSFAMRSSMFILSLGSIFAGIDYLYVFDINFFKDTSSLIKYLPMGVSIIGIIYTIIHYKFLGKLFDGLKTKYSSVYSILSNGFYFDEIYDVIFIQNFKKISAVLFDSVETKFINGKGIKGTVSVIRNLSQYMSRYQSGLIYNYIAIMVIFVVIILTGCLFLWGWHNVF